MSAERPAVQPCLVQLRRLTHATGQRPSRRAPRRARLLVLAVICAAGLGSALPASALAALPDGRAYEQVTPPDKNGIDTGAGIGSVNGNAVYWEGLGGCCGATSSAVTLYQSSRTAGGWQTGPRTPKPPSGLVGLFQEQAPLWWSPDLSQTIYTTPAEYDSRDQRVPGPGGTSFLDLYLQGPSGDAMTWLSQPFPAAVDNNPFTATFSAAAPNDPSGSASGITDGNFVGFESPEQLTANATGLADLNTPPQFVYERNVAAGTTELINVDNSGALLNPDGAILGNGNFLAQSFLAANQFGTTTNAISRNGSKLFFESPPTFPGGGDGGEGIGPAHLYMRDVTTHTTTPLDDPSNSTAGAQYEGAAQDGSRVFFTSSEGLDGSNSNNELYEYNTNTMSRIPVTAGDGTGDSVIGVTAISNDGTHVYFIATGVLATNSSAAGVTPAQTATDGQPNFYVFDASTGTTTFIATLNSSDVSSKQATGGVVLAAEPDLSRPAIPTPDGSVLAFDSSTNLTGQNPAGPTTTLDQDASSGDTSITVSDASGLVAGRTLLISSATGTDTEVITSISGSTVQIKPALVFSYSSGQSVSETAPYEIYRYATNNSIKCVSCTPAGVTPTGNASFGASGGGSYEPPGTGVPMSADGSRIFFDTPDPLVPNDTNTGVFASGGLFGGTTQSQDVYEWEGGHAALISDGHSQPGATLGGTTPSGNDVFLTTVAQLVPQDTDGFDDIYDARVGGGFPASGPGPGACSSAESCHPAVSPTVFFPVPSSSTLIAPPTITPSFRVNSISAKQRKNFAKTGKLTITVHANEAGKIRAGAYANLSRGQVRMSSASATLSSPSGGTARLKLRLNAAARKALAKKHKLKVSIEVTFSKSSEFNVASMTLTKKAKHPTKKHHRRVATKHHSRRGA